MNTATKLALTGLLVMGIEALPPAHAEASCSKVSLSDFSQVQEGDTRAHVQRTLKVHRQYDGEGTTVISYIWGSKECGSGRAQVTFSKGVGQPYLVVGKRWLHNK